MASEIKQGTLDFIYHLPILQVITPMLIAPVLVVLNNKTLSWLLSFVGALACLLTVSYTHLTLPTMIRV